MRITLAFTDDETEPGDMPLLVAALDEYTQDHWGGEIPDWYTDEIKKYTTIREVNITIPDAAVRALFSIPSLDATVLS